MAVWLVLTLRSISEFFKYWRNHLTSSLGLIIGTVLLTMVILVSPFISVDGSGIGRYGVKGSVSSLYKYRTVSPSLAGSGDLKDVFMERSTSSGFCGIMEA